MQCLARRCAVLVLVGLAALGGCLPGAIGAHLIFETKREPARAVPPRPFEDVSFRGEGVLLRGWLLRATPPRRGLIVFLHGRNQNREQVLPIAARLVPRGYDVLAYDGRAHGASTGTFSTFGFFEKRDLSRAIDHVRARDVIVMGVSLGGAVALQAGPDDPRIKGLIAVSTFSTLERIVRQQIPAIVPNLLVRGSLQNAAAEVGIRAEEVDAVQAARRIRVPVLLLHGAADDFTPPEHSRRVYEALAGPRELVIVDGARHNDVLAHECAWAEIESWLSAYGEPGAPRVAGAVRPPSRASSDVAAAGLECVRSQSTASPGSRGNS